MSEHVTPEPQAFDASRYAEAGALILAGGVGAASGWVGGAALESSIHPEQTVARKDLEMQIGAKQVGLQGLKIEVMRKEHGYPSRSNHTVGELIEAQTRVGQQIAELGEHKAPLDAAHGDYVTTTILAGAAIGLAIRGGTRSIRALLQRQPDPVRLKSKRHYPANS